MPKKKRLGRPRKQPEPAPVAVTKIKKRRKPAVEPVPLVAEVKSVMHRIFESQQEQLIQLSEDIQQVRFLGW
jgi:hypothetical protein